MLMEPKLEQLKLRKPTIWSVPSRRGDCYIRMTDIKGSRSNTEAHISCAEISPSTRPDKATFAGRKTSERNEPMDMNPIGVGEMGFDDSSNGNLSGDEEEGYLPAGKKEAPLIFDKKSSMIVNKNQT
ncbi:hypothetical protein QAD02_020468 [Eretmocerus hayati]|uniref:Uncharacterized protein n=1 Tax=Eretmocerus hayati TaxID=131215 RepID=A0ACC2PSB8_9HYME|nr:hypothetical protein QAD02_020468 [Eretmocerus hayati]